MSSLCCLSHKYFFVLGKVVLFCLLNNIAILVFSIGLNCLVVNTGSFYFLLSAISSLEGIVEKRMKE